MNMKVITLFSFLLCITCVKSEWNIDYLLMNEAHIEEYRVNEDDNAGYPPFYVECRENASDIQQSCNPAIPVLNDNEGRVTIAKSVVHDDEGQMYVERVGESVTQFYYGCLQAVDREKVHNPGHFEKTLILMKAEKISNPYEHDSTVSYDAQIPFVSFLNSYRYRCEEEVTPTMWNVLVTQQNTIVYHRIGFKISGHKPITLAEVYYDYKNKIPIRTKHALHGASLAAPIPATKPVETLIYERTAIIIPEIVLKQALKGYYEFNNAKNYARTEANDFLSKSKIASIPDNCKISMAHLIPEYDMIDNISSKIPNFVQTIAPMWTDLYHDEWADIEESIREFAFRKERTLTIYSGTHGQLVLGSKSQSRPFKLMADRFSSTSQVTVPEMLWKAVIDKQNTSKGITKKAIVMILCNITRELEDLEIFTKISTPCTTKCSVYGWRKLDRRQLFCCEVNEVNSIDGIPSEIKNGAYEVLRG